jgi:CheY-like chemotaxis protein
MRILVVDDSPAVRARLVALLGEIPGVLVEEAGHAEDALVRLRAHAIDVVVVDLHMPGRDGADALVEIKRMPGPPVVVVWTAHPTEHSRRRCMQHGADLFLDKSADFQALHDLIATLLVTRPSS